MSYAQWSPYTTYVIGDAVSYNGDAFQATAINTNVPPLPATPIWTDITPTGVLSVSAGSNINTGGTPTAVVVNLDNALTNMLSINSVPNVGLILNQTGAAGTIDLTSVQGVNVIRSGDPKITLVESVGGGNVGEFAYSGGYCGINSANALKFISEQPHAVRTTMVMESGSVGVFNYNENPLIGAYAGAGNSNLIQAYANSGAVVGDKKAGFTCAAEDGRRITMEVNQTQNTRSIVSDAGLEIKTQAAANLVLNASGSVEIPKVGGTAELVMTGNGGSLFMRNDASVGEIVCNEPFRITGEAINPTGITAYFDTGALKVQNATATPQVRADASGTVSAYLSADSNLGVAQVSAQGNPASIYIRSDGSTTSLETSVSNQILFAIQGLSQATINGGTGMAYQLPDTNTVDVHTLSSIPSNTIAVPFFYSDRSAGPVIDDTLPIANFIFESGGFTWVYSGVPQGLTGASAFCTAQFLEVDLNAMAEGPNVVCCWSVVIFDSNSGNEYVSDKVVQGFNSLQSPTTTSYTTDNIKGFSGAQVHSISLKTYFDLSTVPIPDGTIARFRVYGYSTSGSHSITDFRWGVKARPVNFIV